MPIRNELVQNIQRKCGVTWHSFRRTAMMTVKVAGARIGKVPPRAIRRYFGWKPKSKMPNEYSADWRRFTVDDVPILPGLIRSALKIDASVEIKAKCGTRIA